MKHVYQPWAGNDSLITDVTKACAQIPEQIEFQVITWREVAVTTLAGEDMMLQTIPVHAGFAQSSSGRDDCLITNGTSFLAGEDMMLQTIPVHAGFAQSSSGRDDCLITNGTSFHLVQTNDVFRIKRRNTPGIRFKIIDEQ